MSKRFDLAIGQHDQLDSLFYGKGGFLRRRHAEERHAWGSERMPCARGAV
jgi:hypothetical protein